MLECPVNKNNCNKNAKLLLDQQMFCAIQSAGPKWKGDIATHCAWCGAKLNPTETATLRQR